MSEVIDRPISMDRIIEVTSGFLRVSKRDLRSQRRHRNIVRARWIAVYLCREMTCASLPMIGRAFGDRDHTTIMHALRETERRLQRDRELNTDIGLLRFVLESDEHG